MPGYGDFAGRSRFVGTSEPSYTPGIRFLVEGELQDTQDLRCCRFKVTKGFSRPARMSWTMYQPEHTREWADLAFCQLIDSDYGDDTKPVFEGHIWEQNPRGSNVVECVAYDPTRRVAHEIYVMSSGYDPLNGNEPSDSAVPRLIFNVTVDTDPDAAHQIGDSSADPEAEDAFAVSDMLAWIFNDVSAVLDNYEAGPTNAIAYLPSDIEDMDMKPQDKVYFESAKFTDAIQNLLQFYPQYQMVFETGSRFWRFFNVKELAEETLTLNSRTEPFVLTKEINRVLDGRYTAVKLYGPLKSVTERFTYEEGEVSTLSPYATTPIVTTITQLIPYSWQITDDTKRRLSHLLPTAETQGAYLLIREPILLVSYDEGDNWEAVQDVRIDYRHGIVRAPTAVYREPEVEGSPKVLPDIVMFIASYYDDPLFVRYPEEGFDGTAYTEAGMESTLRKYEPSLAVGFENGVPVGEEERTEQMQKLAENMHSLYCDIVYTGGLTIQGVNYTFWDLNKRVNLAAIDGDGDPLTTGWEDAKMIVTDVEIDYGKVPLTTLTFSSDILEYSEDPEEFKRRLGIDSTWYYRDTKPLFNIGTTLGYTFGSMKGDFGESGASYQSTVGRDGSIVSGDPFG